MPLKIDRLKAGGLITTYRCSSRCGHCLYASGPTRSRRYMTFEAAWQYLCNVRELGCNSVHLGGGEPLMDHHALAVVLVAAEEAEVAVEYVETNCAWFSEPEAAQERLAALKKIGLHTLLVSISPFHNQFIPLARVKGVLQACQEVGIRTIPWTPELLADLEQFDPERPHSLQEYEQRLGPDYLRRLPERYWIHMGGRALATFSRVYEPTPLSELLAASGPCQELLDTSHFHLDLYGNYIPGLCTGLGFNQSLLGQALPPEDYPLLTRLIEQGPAGLLDWARDQAGFQPQPAYLNKCHLCLDIRAHLVKQGRISRDLCPLGFYRNLGPA